MLSFKLFFFAERSVDVQEVNENSIRGMVLPFEPLSVTFDEIRYSVDMPPVIFLSY